MVHAGRARRNAPFAAVAHPIAACGAAFERRAEPQGSSRRSGKGRLRKRAAPRTL
jgi:hypothetical protein